jgi:hypothetical protein
MKDYVLEIHYHLRNANVTANTLGHKHHYNHLIVQSLTSYCDSEESSVLVVPLGTLTNIALIPTIKEKSLLLRGWMLEWVTSE